jgi:DNA repair ATPase RecN
MTKKSKSRSVRWANAASEALNIINQLIEVNSDLGNAIQKLKSVQEEYEEWLENLPKDPKNLVMGKKLEEVCGLDIEDLAGNVLNILKEVQRELEEANSIDLPRSFGKD